MKLTINRIMQTAGYHILHHSSYIIHSTHRTIIYATSTVSTWHLWCYTSSHSQHHCSQFSHHEYTIQRHN